MVRRVNRFLDKAISYLTKAMVAALIIGAVLVVTSEFYEPALGKWSIAVAIPYALVIPVYLLKLILGFYEKVTRSFLKHR